MADYSEGTRAKLASQGDALEDGSYPVPDCAALRDAVDAYGRAPDSHRKPLAALIRRRHDELGGCGITLDKLEDD